VSKLPEGVVAMDTAERFSGWKNGVEASYRDCTLAAFDGTREWDPEGWCRGG